MEHAVSVVEPRGDTEDDADGNDDHRVVHTCAADRDKGGEEEANGCEEDECQGDAVDNTWIVSFKPPTKICACGA